MDEKLRITDPVDLRLIDLVQADGRAAHADLARLVGLSTSAVHERLRKLVVAGVMAPTARIDPAALGLDLLAFVLVALDRPAHEPGFRAAITGMPQILECHHVTGDWSYLLKLRCRDTGDCEALLSALKAIPGLVRTHSLIALSTVKETAVLPAVRDGSEGGTGHA